MSPIQILLLAIIAGIIYKTWKKRRAAAITVQEFFLWTVFWLLGAGLVLFPEITQRVARFVGIGRGVDLVIYISLTLLFFGLFYVLVRLERLERDVTKITRKMALEENRPK